MPMWIRPVDLGNGRDPVEGVWGPQDSFEVSGVWRKELAFGRLCAGFQGQYVAEKTAPRGWVARVRRGSAGTGHRGTSILVDQWHIRVSWVARVKPEVFSGIPRVRLFIGQPALVTEAQVSTLTSGTHASWVARVKNNTEAIPKSLCNATQNMSSA